MKPATKTAKKKVLSLPSKQKNEAPRDSELELLSPYIAEVAGVQGLKIIKSIGDGATDEVIEKNTGLKIAEIRSILNHLHSYGIVEYTREKNLTTGWFTYTWRVNANRALQNFIYTKQKEYSSLKARLSSEENSLIFACKNNCKQYNFDEAVENKFKCQSCNGSLKELDRTTELAKLEQKIIALNKISEMIASNKKIISGSPSSGVAATQKLLKKIIEPKNYSKHFYNTSSKQF
ncbi:MAG: hypothetical protein ACP5O3_03840 [Candidatus Micrarchaeia archaeon]|jgi:transcription factor E